MISICASRILRLLHISSSYASSLEQVYRVPTPTDNAETLAKRPLYNKRNAFFDSASLNDLADAVERVPQRADLQAALEGAKAEYNALSEEYQRHKGQADIAFA